MESAETVAETRPKVILESWKIGILIYLTLQNVRAIYFVIAPLSIRVLRYTENELNLIPRFRQNSMATKLKSSEAGKIPSS